jgi:hypothetical protein
MRLQVKPPGFHIPGGAQVDSPHLLTVEEEAAVRAAPNAEKLLSRTMNISDEAAAAIEAGGPVEKLPPADGGDPKPSVAPAPPQAAAAQENGDADKDGPTPAGDAQPPPVITH